jgi:dCTP deaminase
MIVNRAALLRFAPMVGMFQSKRTENGVSCGLAEAGYDIRIRQTVVFARPNCSMDFHHSVGNEAPRVGRFALASAMEEFDMPEMLCGVVHDKSTWARQGLSVFNTVIEPGWKGFLTLELVYHGNKPLIIPAGSGIAQVLFHQTVLPASYTGKYQNQADEPVSSIFEETK